MPRPCVLQLGQEQRTLGWDASTFHPLLCLLAGWEHHRADTLLGLSLDTKDET